MSERRCFANFHMRPEEYALWDVSRSLSRETGILYFDGRKMAARFEGGSKSRMYRIAKQLLEKGWYEVIAPGVRDRRTGLYTSTQYHVLSAEEWAARYPHVCGADAHPENGSGARGTANGPVRATSGRETQQHPVPSTGTASPQNGTYSAKENSAEEKRYDTASAALNAAQAAYREFSENMGDDQRAFAKLLWILYRAASPSDVLNHVPQIPQTLTYYRTADSNFEGQYEYGQECILERAYDRFSKHAARFIQAKSPELLAWLCKKSAEL